MANRKLDILVMQDINTATDISLVGFNFGDIARSVSGVQKAVQQWVTKLLTIKGSVLSDETFGTKFLSDLKATNLNDREIISGLFNEAVREIKEWDLSNVDISTLADDEYVVSATLLDINQKDISTIQLNVQLLTADGVAREYIVPLPVGAAS